MTKPKYQIRENDGFAACVAKFSVLYNGKIIHRTDDKSDAHAYVQQAINDDRTFAMEGR